MDRVADGGVGWRRLIGDWLRFRGVEVFDPSDKPIDIGIEDIESRKQRQAWKASEQYHKVAEHMKVIANTDLRMVDIVDFLVVNIDVSVHACGTYEETTLANSQKKPVVFRIEQGKKDCPDWLLGRFPHQMIFSTWGEVHRYLEHIDHGKRVESLKRWVFFDHNKTKKDRINTIKAEYRKVVKEFGYGSTKAKRFRKEFKW